MRDGPPRRQRAPPPARPRRARPRHREGAEISVSAIARAAGVDRSFLYRHRDLLEQDPRPAAEPPATRGRRPGGHPGLAAGRPARRPRTRRPAPHPSPTPRDIASPTPSASTPGASPGSAPRPTSTPSTSRSPGSSSRSSTWACNSPNATRTSPPPAPPTASSWPASTLPTPPGEPPEPLAPHLLRSLTFPSSASELRKREESATATEAHPRRRSATSPSARTAPSPHRHRPADHGRLRNLSITALRLAGPPTSPPRYATTPATHTARSPPTRSPDDFASARQQLKPPQGTRLQCGHPQHAEMLRRSVLRAIDDPWTPAGLNGGAAPSATVEEFVIDLSRRARTHDRCADWHHL